MSHEEVDKVIRIIWQTLLKIPESQRIMGTRMMPSVNDLDEDDNYVCIGLTRRGERLCMINVYRSGMINFVASAPGDGDIEFVKFSELGEDYKFLPIFVIYYVHSRLGYD